MSSKIPLYLGWIAHTTTLDNVSSLLEDGYIRASATVDGQDKRFSDIQKTNSRVYFHPVYSFVGDYVVQQKLGGNKNAKNATFVINPDTWTNNDPRLLSDGVIYVTGGDVSLKRQVYCLMFDGTHISGELLGSPETRVEVALEAHSTFIDIARHKVSLLPRLITPEVSTYGLGALNKNLPSMTLPKSEVKARLDTEQREIQDLQDTISPSSRPLLAGLRQTSPGLCRLWLLWTRVQPLLKEQPLDSIVIRSLTELWQHPTEGRSLLWWVISHVHFIKDNLSIIGDMSALMNELRLFHGYLPAQVYACLAWQERPNTPSVVRSEVKKIIRQCDSFDSAIIYIWRYL